MGGMVVAQPPPELLEERHLLSQRLACERTTQSVSVGFTPSRSSLVLAPRATWACGRYSIPFSRSRPAPQLVWRADGKNVRDGAGLGSPAFVLPERFHLPDPLGPFTELVLAHAKVLEPALRAFENATKGADTAGRARTAAKLGARVQSVTAVLVSECVTRGLFEPELMEIAPGQPFRLCLISRLAEWAGDPDAAFPLRLEHGLHLGSEKPIDDSGLWPLKGSEEDPFRSWHPDYKLWEANYRSFEENREEAIRKLQVDVDQGFARGGFSWEEMCAQVLEPGEVPPPRPDSSGSRGVRGSPPATVPGFAAARLGAVPQGDSVRLVVDGTVGGVNAACSLPETMQTPGLLEVLAGMAPGLPTWKALKVDIKSAFKRIRLVKSDWRRALFSVEGEWFFYVTLPFGMRASAYWWVRFYAILHRVLHWVLIKFPHGGLVYIDDSLWLFEEDSHARLSALVLLVLSLCGAPLAWEKTQSGSVVDWVGFEVNFAARSVAVGPSKVAKLQDLFRHILEVKSLRLPRFLSGLGTMCWAAAACPLSRVLLAPLFRIAHSPEVQSSSVVRDLRTVRLSVALWLEVATHAVAPRQFLPVANVVLRTDAMADSCVAWIAGWFQEPGQDEIAWFSCQVPIAIFPKAKETPSRLISALEMLAMAVAVNIWGGKVKGALALPMETDSRVSFLSVEGGSAHSPNMVFALQELAHAAISHEVDVRPRHIPGVTNVLADGLSRRFSWIWNVVSPANQVAISFSEMCPLALKWARGGDFDPFTGQCVGQAKKPGPAQWQGFFDRSLPPGFAVIPAEWEAVLSWLCVGTAQDVRDLRASGVFQVDACVDAWPADHALAQVRARELFRVLCSAPLPLEVGSPTAGLPSGTPTAAQAAPVGGRPLVVRPKEVRTTVPAVAMAPGPPPSLGGPQVAGGSSRPLKSAKIASWACGTRDESGTGTRHTEKGKKALQVVSSTAEMASALGAFQVAFFADATWSSHASEVKLFEKICAAHRPPLVPFPLSVVTLEMFLAVLRAAGYKAPDQYLSALVRHHKLAFPSETAVLVEIGYRRSMWTRAGKRDKGDPHRMEPVDLLMMQAMRRHLFSPSDVFAFALFAVEWFFLLRSAEALAIAPSHVSFVREGCVPPVKAVLAKSAGILFFSADEVARTVFHPSHGHRFRARLLIPKDKTNQVGRTVVRMLDCVCEAARFPCGQHMEMPAFCPVHSLAWLCCVHGHRGATPDSARGEKQAFGGGAGGGAWSPGPYCERLRLLLQRAGVATVELVAGVIVQLFGTHSLRRGGAQALARAGWSLDAIKFFGRWLSDVVELYLLEAPFAAKGHLLARSMVGKIPPVGVGQDVEGKSPPAVCRAQLGVGSGLRVFLPPTVLPWQDVGTVALEEGQWIVVRLLALGNGLQRAASAQAWFLRHDTVTEWHETIPAGAWELAPLSAGQALPGQGRPRQSLIVFPTEVEWHAW